MGLENPFGNSVLKHTRCVVQKLNNGSVLVSIRSGNKIILTRQPQKRPPVLWKLPGGKIEDGETPQEAAVREVAEETEIDIRDQILSEPTEYPMNGPAGPYVQYVFEVSVPEQLIKKHVGAIIETIDDEGQKLESTSFEMSELAGMGDFMPKHAKFLDELESAPA